MRIVPVLLWIVASLLWLPWFAIFIALIVELAGGTPLDHCKYLNPALVGAWPVLGWLHWRVVSWLPIGALCAVALSIWAWRLKAHMQDQLVGWPLPQRIVSCLIPPLALLFAYREAKYGLQRVNRRLESDVAEAQNRYGRA